jgi:hypothetical protein
MPIPDTFPPLGDSNYQNAMTAIKKFIRNQSSEDVRPKKKASKK